MIKKIKILFVFIIGLSQPCVVISDSIEQKNSQAQHEVQSSEIIEQKSKMDTRAKQMLIAKDSTLKGYKFKYGYYKYDEDVYGFQNPGYFEIYKNNKLIFKENIQSYEEMSVSFLGCHVLKIQFLVISLNYGLAACDYIQAKRLYCISNDNKVYFIDEFKSQSTDYAYKKVEFLFPQDKNGIENRLVVIDGVYYREENEPDIFKTLYYDFVNSGFTKTEMNKNK